MLKFNFYKLKNISISIATACLLISCGGGGGGTATNYNSGPSSSGGTFLDSGTSVTYNSTTASNHQAYDAYENVKGTSQSSHQNPFDQINAYKAYGYGYSGDGKEIAILDSAFDTNHYTYTGKTLSTYGTLAADTTSSYHGNTVSGVAAGYLDTSYSGSVAAHGVAYDADLHLSDYTQKGSATYYATHWANATNNAAGSGTVAQNNSWGIDEQYSSSTSYSTSSLATMWTNEGYTSNASSVQDYLNSLNAFQNTGVIVYALSNDDTFTEADVQAALPEIDSNLAEAWITAVNVDITGSSGNESYSIKSAPCGSTAKYCLGADGWKINAAADYTSGSYFLTGGTQGTSFVAPQISGAIAILAEAFSSGTPEQWTDRLLASADNSFYTATGNVEFANGITHGYNSTYGHGIMDIYAALRPITSSRMQESILIGENTETASVHNLSKTSIKSNSIFGDSISRSFENKKGYFYDALYGAFEYDFSKHLQHNQKTNEIDLNNHFNEQNLQSVETVAIDQNIKTNFSFVTNTNNQLILDQGINYSISRNNKNLSASYNYPLDVSLGFISSNEIKKISHKKNSSISYIDSEGIHYSTSSKIFDNGETSVNLGYLQTDKSNLIEKNALALSFTNKELDTALLIGQSNEKNGFLNNSFEGALSVEDNNPTNFIAFKKNKKINAGELMFVSSFGTTDVKNNNNSLIRNIDDIYTTSFAVNFSKPNMLFKNSILNFSISQPQRVESGSMTYDIPDLNDKDGTLNYTTYTSDLDPSGRQVDLSVKYIVSDKIGINYIIENKLINDHGHISRDDLDYQLAALMMYQF
ncbi:S8 family serine peptidase [Pelagibacteraceae bacterium]|nr:S8 family serine peptidase [Pelagibacteraceae bacterium]